MPELPEVETFKRFLEKRLLNLTVINVELKIKKSLRNSQAIELEKLKGQKINSLSRFGKYIIFNFDDDYLISHLRLEGKWFIVTPKRYAIINPNHIIINLELSDGDHLVLTDHRKFATLDFFPNTLALEDNPIFLKQGKEPWDLSHKDLKQKLERSPASIKSKLLDQKVISGLGNIYVDEVLFACKISPLRSAMDVKDDEITCILEKSKSILSDAIDMGGTTIYTFAVDDNKGGYLHKLRVHLKKGQLCSNCKIEKISKTSVGGRGTYYCHKCQN